MLDERNKPFDLLKDILNKIENDGSNDLRIDYSTFIVSSMNYDRFVRDEYIGKLFKLIAKGRKTIDFKDV